MSSLILAGVSKVYPGGVVGLHPTDFALEAGDRLVLLGPSGSGKTTLLRLIAGLEDPDSGEIRIGGLRADRLPPHRRGVGMLPQKPALYPHLTVEQNIHIVATDGGTRNVERRGAIRSDYPLSGPASRAVELLRLGPLLSRYPHQLSAGERQRVALARLLARGAGVWLLDEPLANLDPMFRAEFRADLHLLLDASAATIIFVTHDPTDAWAFGRRVGVLGGGQLRQLGTPEELHARPANRFVAACLGRLSLIDGTVAASDGRAGGGDRSGPIFVSECGSVKVPLPDALARLGPEPAPNLALGIRPEDVHPALPGGFPKVGLLIGWPVVSAEPVGSGWLLSLGRGRTRVRAWQPSGTPPPVGQPADWYIPADRCEWFDGATGRRIDAEPGFAETG